MFEEDEGVADAVLVAGLDERFLEGEALGVGDTAELEEVEDHLEQIAKLFERKSGIANNGEHREGIDGIVPRDRDGSATVGHDNMPTLPNHFKASSFQSPHGLKVIDAGKLPHQDAITST
jgi:hypothetical protein